MKKKSTLFVLVTCITFIVFELIISPVNNKTKAATPYVPPTLPVGVAEYTLVSYALTDLVDNDDDGYFSSAILKITLNVSEEGTCLAHINTSVCKCQEETGPCPYFTTKNLCFDDDSTFSISIGAPNDELEKDTYQIKFMVYEYTETNVVFDWTDVEIIQMESAAEDLPLVIDTCYWEERYDCDGDGYISFGKIFMDFEKTPSYGKANVEIWLEENTASQIVTLNGGIIDFPAKNYIFDVWGPATLETPLWVVLIDPSDNDTLAICEFPGTQYLEDPNQDNYSISCITGNMYSLELYEWDGHVDDDYDDYFSYITVSYNVDLIEGTDHRMVYAKAYIDTQKVDINDFSLHHTSSEFLPDFKNDMQYMIIQGYPHNRYYIAFELYDAETDDMVMERTLIEDSVTLELPEEDIAILFDSCFWTNIKDCDEDDSLSFGQIITLFDKTIPYGEGYLFVWVEAEDSPRGLMIAEHYFELPLLADTVDIWAPASLSSPLWIIAGLSTYSGIEYIDTFRFPGIQKFEDPVRDHSFTVEHMEWDEENDVDNDKDCYYSERRLKINYNTCLLSLPFYIEVSVCKDPIMAGPCLYYTSPVIYPDETEEIFIDFGGENPELSKGKYYISLRALWAENDDVLVDHQPLPESVLFENSQEDMMPDIDFSIKDVYTDDKIDLDNDCCGRKRNLYIDADVSCGAYDVWAKIYYKKSSALKWELFKSTETFTINSNDNEYHKTSIGPDNRFVHGNYDFAIELYQDTTIVAKKCPSHDSDIKEICFESPINDQADLIDTFYWSKYEDWDGDGLFSYGEMTILLHAVSPMKVYIDMIAVYGNSMLSLNATDTLDLVTGINTVTLEVKNIHFHYFWSPEIAVRSYDEHEPIDFRNDHTYIYKCEYPHEDIAYTVESFELTELIDNDGDGYYSHALLNVDIDANPLPSDVYLDVSMCGYPILAGPCHYVYSGVVEANNTSTDIISVDIGSPNNELSQNKYQLGFFVLKSVTDDLAVGWTYVDTIHMEPEEDDIAIEIDTAYWINLTDYDGDGFSSYGDLVTIFDVHQPVDDVYLELRGWYSDFTIHMVTSDIFDISLYDTLDTLALVGQKNFHFNGGILYLKKHPGGEIIDEYYIPPYLKFEAPEEDITYTLSSCFLSDSVDIDGDGYLSHVTFNVDINSPIPSKVYMHVSMCKHPIMAGPCIYLETPNFEVDATSLDLYSVDIGLPNDELSYGTYQLDFVVFDSINNEQIIGWEHACSNLNMELSGEDILSDIPFITMSILEIYPNPFHDKLFIKLNPSSENEEYTIELLNANGELLDELYTGRLENHYSELHDLGHLSSGVYILKINTSGNYAYIKLIKY